MIEKVNKTFYEATGNRLSNISHLKLFNLLNDVQDNTKLLNIFNNYRIDDKINSAIYYDTYDVANND